MGIQTKTTRVSAYETSDGQVFKNKPDARLHEAKLAIRTLADSLASGTDTDPHIMALDIIDEGEKWLAALVEWRRAHDAVTRDNHERLAAAMAEAA